MRGLRLTPRRALPRRPPRRGGDQQPSPQTGHRLPGARVHVHTVRILHHLQAPRLPTPGQTRQKRPSPGHPPQVPGQTAPPEGMRDPGAHIRLNGDPGHPP